MKSSKEDLVWLVLLKTFSDNFSANWDEMRALLKDNARAAELDEYFNKIFVSGIKERILYADTSVYRARQIKTQDWNKTGVALNDIYNRFYSILVKEEDIVEASKIKNLPLTIENLFFLKFGKRKKITKKELKCFNAFLEEFSHPNFYGFLDKECGCPPKEFRKDQRLSTAQDEYLYVSLEMDTAIYEMRPSIKQSYSVARGKILKDVRLAELQDISKYNGVSEFEISTLLAKISEANTDNDTAFYKITQQLSQFIKSNNFDGIVYQSSIKQNGTNIMMFNPAMVRFTESSVISINNVAVDYTVCFPLITGTQENF